MNQGSGTSQPHDGRLAEAHDESSRARSDLNVTWTAIAGFVGAIVIFVLIVAVQILFQRTEDAEFQQKVVAQVDVQLAQLRAQQLERLNTYRLLDEKQGIVAIPIEQAMQLVARNPAIRPVVPTQPPATQTQPAAQTRPAGQTQPAAQAPQAGTASPIAPATVPAQPAFGPGQSRIGQQHGPATAQDPAARPAPAPARGSQP